MPDFNNDGKTDGLDYFITAETYEQSNRPAPTAATVLDKVLTAIFWLAMFLLVVIFC